MKIRGFALLLSFALGFTLACTPEEETACDMRDDGFVLLYGVCVRDEQCVDGATCLNNVCQEKCVHAPDCNLGDVRECITGVCYYACDLYPQEAFAHAECTFTGSTPASLVADTCLECGGPYCTTI